MARGGRGPAPGADRIRTWTTVLSGLAGSTAGLMLGIAYVAFEDGQHTLALALGGLTVVMVVVLLFLVLLARALAVVLQRQAPRGRGAGDDAATAQRLDDLETDFAALSQAVAQLASPSTSAASPATAGPPAGDEDASGPVGLTTGEDQPRSLASRSSTSK